MGHLRESAEVITVRSISQERIKTLIRGPTVCVRSYRRRNMLTLMPGIVILNKAR